MSGGVRNLRAMFENKDESFTPPPDRGRSPAGSVGGGSNGTSPRPLSKVRTSFVAVERNGQLGGQWGLRKESNVDPSLATRRGSFSIDEETDPKAMSERKQSINSEISARKNSTSVVETIPEFAIETPPVLPKAEPAFINGHSGREKTAVTENTNPSSKLDKKFTTEERSARLSPNDTKSNINVSGVSALSQAIDAGSSVNGKSYGEIKTLSPIKTTTKPNSASRSPKPTPISTAPSANATKAPTKVTKSSMGPKTPTTPAKTPSTPGKSAKQTSSNPTVSGSTTQTRLGEKHINKPTPHSVTAKPAPRPSTSSTVASTSEKTAYTVSSTGFHKPRPRSPTKPAKLPASMTAPTASSLSKVSASAIAPVGRQSLAPPTKTVSRSSSNTNLGQNLDLRRRPSTINNDRPALGRPSTSSLKRQPSRPSFSRQTAPADESFLARMMRPTTSSASKTTEKVTTPPRPKVVTRPNTRDGPSLHKPHDAPRGSPSSKKFPSVPKGAKNEGPKVVSADTLKGAAISASNTGPSDPVIAEKENTKPTIIVKDEKTTSPVVEKMPTQEKGSPTVAKQPSAGLEVFARSNTTLGNSTGFVTDDIPELSDRESAVEKLTLQKQALMNGEDFGAKIEDAPKFITPSEPEAPVVNGKASVQIEDLETTESFSEFSPEKTITKGGMVIRDEDEVD